MYWRKDGTSFPIEFTSSPLFEDDRLSGAVVTFKDITERKVAESAKANLSAIVESTNVAIISLTKDLNGIIQTWNKGAEKVYGYSAEEAVGRNVSMLVPPDHPNDVPEILLKLKQGEAIEHYETQRMRKDGTTINVALDVSPIRDAKGGIIGASAIARDITERKRAEVALQQLGRRTELILATAGEGILGLDAQGAIIFLNAAAAGMFGYPPDELIGMNCRLMYHRSKPDGTPYPAEDCPIDAAFRQGTDNHGEETFWKKDGTGFPVDFTSKPLFEENSIIGAVVTFRDITERKGAEERLKRSKALSDELNKISKLVHSTFDTEGIMTDALEGAARALGADGAWVGLFDNGSQGLSIRFSYNMPESLKDRCCSPEEAKGIQYVASHNDAFAFNDLATDTRVNAGFWKMFGFSAVLAAPLTVRQNVIGSIMFFRRTHFVYDDADIDFARKLSATFSAGLDNASLYQDRRQMEEEMRQLAHHDTLTGLPNRRLFQDIMNVELKQANRHKKKLAILFLDLDRFKEVNDTFGHNAGDVLLKEAALRLQVVVRGSDTIARIGGDEFNLILADLSRPEDSADIAAKIIRSFQEPFSIAGQELRITTSVGISIYPDDSTEVDALLRYADIAMYHAKENGRNKYQFYDASINFRSLERIRLESMLQRSLQLGEMVIYYQPLVDLKTRRVVSAEALARWRHPERGLLEPKEFLPAAEETGFINAIDEWALRTACKQVRVWLDAGNPPVSVIVNLSARRFQEPDLIKKVSAILKDAGVPPGCLDLEITETTAMANVAVTAVRMRELSEMGIGISIDDFGTGYSSLSYLKKLPIERLKIDQSFIQDIPGDPDDRAVVEAVTAMAHNMKMKVVAEGVETEEQLEFVRRTGCDEMQGFLFSKPLPAEEFQELVRARG